MKINISDKIKGLLEPGQSLSQKVVRGGIWVFALRIADRILHFGQTIILARLLAPSDFGLFGIACLTINTLEEFTKTGFGTALIQKKEKTERYLDTTWTVSIIRGSVLFLILFFSAPFAASFFNSPKAMPIIRVIAMTLLFGAVSNIGIIYFTKELDFRKQFIFQITRTIANIGVAIPLALILRNTWALVWGMLARSIAGCIMSYIVHPYRPKLHFEPAKAKELFTFGKWLFASTIIIFLVTQGDDILVGKLLGAAALGFYTMAYAISNLPATEITHVISEVTFPAYSKLQDNLPKLREAYLKVLQLTVFISIPLAGGIFILAPEFTKIFLGQKWMPMVPAMQVLCIYGVIRSIAATNGPLFVGSGKPNLDTKVALIKLIAMIIIIYPLTIKWGIAGTALATTLPVIISQLYGISKVINILNCNFKIWWRNIHFSLMGTIIMISLIHGTKSLIWSKSIVSALLFYIVFGAIFYFIFMLFTDKFYSYGLKSNLKAILQNTG